MKHAVAPINMAIHERKPLSVKTAVILVDMVESIRGVLTYNIDGKTNSDKKSIDMGLKRFEALIETSKFFDLPIFFSYPAKPRESFINPLANLAGENAIPVGKTLTSAFDEVSFPSFLFMGKKYGYLCDAKSIAETVKRWQEQTQYPLLRDYLPEERITLILAGFNRTYCVLATAMDAVHLGHKVLTSDQLMFGNTDFADDGLANALEFYRTKTEFYETSEGLIAAMSRLVQVS